MPTYEVIAPDGRKLEIIGDTAPTEAELDEIFASLPPATKPASTLTPVGIAEPAATLATGAIAEPLAGLAGLASMLPQSGEYVPSLSQLDQMRSGQQPPNPGQVVEATRGALTYEPSTPEGRQNLVKVGETLKPITDILQAAEKAGGELGYDLAGPIGGAIGETLPTAIAELLGLKAVRMGKKLSSTDIPEADSLVIEMGRERGVPVLTSDVIQPETFAGKFLQGLSEKMGPLGSGSARRTQQQTRQAIVEGLADEFDIELESDFAAQMVKSINRKSAETLRAAGEQRNRAVSSLVQYGEVPVSRTLQAIDQQLARQARLGEKADTALVDNLNKVRSSIQGGDFSLVKDIRTEVISDLKALNRSDDPRAAGSLQQVKSAIDQDMLAFARKNDRTAAKDWLQSNRVFANELTATRQTELRRILNSGDATPEVVMPILKGGKRSQLIRLRGSLTVDGQRAARAAILQDALKESGFFSGDINPDRFTNALQRPARQQAVRVFFDETGDKQIDGLTRLLDATRRAQQASATPATGVQNIPFLAAGGIGYGMSSNPFLTIATAGTMAAFAKAYESAPVRNLLLKIANSKPGSKVETGLLEQAVPALAGALQAAKAQRPQTDTQE